MDAFDLLFQQPLLDTQTSLFEISQQIPCGQTADIEQVALRAGKIWLELGWDVPAEGVVKASGLRENELRLMDCFGRCLWHLPESHHERQHVVIKCFAAHPGWTGRGGFGRRSRDRALAALLEQTTHCIWLDAEPRRHFVG